MTIKMHERRLLKPIDNFEAGLPSKLAPMKTAEHGDFWVQPIDVTVSNAGIELSLPVALLGSPEEGLLIAPVYTSCERALLLDVGREPIRIHAAQLERLLPNETALAIDYGHSDQEIVAYEIWCPATSSGKETTTDEGGAIDDWISRLE